MELSPIAKERLNKIGKLTDEEKRKLKDDESLKLMLSKYFKNELSADALWEELKKHKAAGRAYLLNATQLKLLETVNMSSTDIDYKKINRGLLAIESLKDNGDCSTLEQGLESINNLRRRYNEEKDKAFEEIKTAVEREVSMAMQQLAGQAAAQGAMVDVQGSVEASARSSPEWKRFVTQHNATYNRQFKDQLQKIRQILKV
ncbi:MAG: hypothetical protein JSV74_01915 [Dehalococcoidia bacterium]|nr:MAG: hypothetical protein JSV74_01915 [Dehalococcoidia bacterium]